MTKRTIIAASLLILLTTITFKKKISVTKFNLQEIKIENNHLIKKEDIKKSLIPIYNKNLIFLKNTEIEKILKENSFIKGFNIKKK